MEYINVYGLTPLKNMLTSASSLAFSQIVSFPEMNAELYEMFSVIVSL